MYIRGLFVTLVGLRLGLAAPIDDGLERRLNNGIGVTPAMGFNNWNAGLSSSAATALAAANAFVSLGLNTVGYQYINIDDTWSQSTRVNGLLTPDATKWPNGIKPVADTIHGLGLKMGLYGDSGTATCSGFPGSGGNETTDANTLAGWGIDFWKYDNCNTPTTGTSQTRYTVMRDALVASGRPIYYAICNWGADQVWTWGLATGNSWRVSSDVGDSWSSVASIAASNMGLASYAGPGGFNDFDMLEIGNGGLTAAEERAHFGLWGICKSPLIIGTDLTKIATASLNVLLNKVVIGINQDSLGIPAAPFQPTGAAAIVSGTLYPYWSGKLSDGYVIGIVAVSAAATFTVNFSDVPGLGAGTYSWTEAYTGTSGSGTSVSATLAIHDMAVFKVLKSGTSVSTTTAAGTTSTSTSTKATTTSSSTTVAVTTTKTTTSTAASTTTSSGGTIAKWGQCAGLTWTGSGTCVSGTTCTYQNAYYSQCL